MKEAIICKPSPAKILAVTAAPLKELLNFLIYRQNPEILNERARRQPSLQLTIIPTNICEIGELLGASKCEKKRKLYFDCTGTEKHRSILIHNFNAQFWVNYFRCGIGLVNISGFSQLASAEGSVLPKMTRTVEDSYEFQWFTHDLADKYFQKDKPNIYLNKLAQYFVKQVNPKLISPYSFCLEEKQSNEPYKFINGSLETLKEIMKQAFLVYEGIKQKRDATQQYRINSSLAVICGNLKQAPTIEYPAEWFINEVGALALKENTPFAVLNESSYRRVETIFSDWVRKTKYRLYLNFHEEIWGATPREKIVAKSHLINWLKRQGSDGERIVKTWRLE